MIDLERLRSVRHIISHTNCADGTVSALLLKDALPEADVRFIQYNTPAHRNLEAVPGMIFCDMTPPRERVHEFVDAMAIVLDHHKGADDLVELFGADGVYASEREQPGVSGAVLAYEHVWRHLQKRDTVYDYIRFVEHLARLVGVYDTWQKTDANWELSLLQEISMRFIRGEDMVAYGSLGLYGVYLDRQHFEWVAPWLMKKRDHTIQQAIKGGYRFTTDKGTKVLMFQGSKLVSVASERVVGSDAPDLLCEFNVFLEDGNVKYVYSVRSRTGFSCVGLAKANGGSGHTAAAGFNITNPELNPYNQFKALLDRFESSKDSPAIEASS